MHIYVEIQADDCTRAVEFYTTIFPSWKFIREPNLPIEYYRGDDADFGEGVSVSLLKRPAPTPSVGHGTNAFVCSFPIKDLDAFEVLEKKVLELGGQVAMPRFPVPERGWHGYFLDTEGNTFGVFTTSYCSKEDLEKFGLGMTDKEA